MSSDYFERRWRECMRELAEQVYQEGSSVDSSEAFRQYALLYVKYMQLFSQLEQVCDQTIHAQKRLSMRTLLDVLMVRITELKAQMIAANKDRPGHKFVALDEVLTDLRLHPDAIEWSFPRFFRQENSDNLQVKAKQLEHWLNTFSKPIAPDSLVPKPAASAGTSVMDLETAIKVVQRNERGRLGIMRLINVLAWRKDKKDKRSSDPADVEFFQNTAAAKIGAYWRGNTTRRQFAKMKEIELAFLGLAPMPQPATDTVTPALEANVAARRAKRAAAAEALEQAIGDEEKQMKQLEGPKMRKIMLDERRQWLLGVRDSTGVYPANLASFYRRNDPPPAPVEEKKKDAAGKAPKEAKEGKKKKESASEAVAATEPIGKKTIAQIDALLKQFEEVWQHRRQTTVSENFESEISRKSLAGAVEESVRQTVDLLLDEELANLKKLYDKAGKKKAKGKAKKPKKAKKAKVKKWCAAVGSIANPVDVIPDLINDNIYKKVAIARLSNFQGVFGFLSSLQRADVYLPAPSAQMIRSNLVEHCMLPLASLSVRQRSAGLTAKSLLLYGPVGNGKSSIARMVAHECGAAFFDLSPRTIEWKYNMGKTGAALLIYKVFLAAQELAPAVIYIDDVEEIFLSTKKKKGAAPAPAPVVPVVAEGGAEGVYATPAEPASRIKKDLIAFMKQIKTGEAATDKDRILFIGATSRPFLENVEQKELIASFEEKIWISFPDYGSRVQLLLSAVEARGVPKTIVYSPTFNVSLLAKTGEGVSVEGLRRAVDDVLTDRRVKQILTNARPLDAAEFVSSLNSQPKCPAEEWVKFREFDHDASGERARLAAAKAALEKTDQDKNKDPKKNKKKK